MGLPHRSHFSVFEVVARWGVTITDMRYYLENGLLQAQVLLAEKLAQIYHRIETPEKEEAWVKKALVMIEGYVAIHHVQVRKVFRLKSAPIDEFHAIEGPDCYRLLREKDITPVTVDDLWISAAECARFERENRITIRNDSEPATILPKTGIVATSSGRPSVMKRITERYQERRDKGEAMSSILAEAKFLRGWARETMPEAQVPSVKTIRNKLYSASAE